MELNKKESKRLLFYACIAIFFAWFLYNASTFMSMVSFLFGIFSPLVLGFCMAFILNVPMKIFENKVFVKLKNGKRAGLVRPLSVLMSLVFIVAFLCFVVGLVVPEFISAIVVLFSSLPGLWTSLQNFVADHGNAIPMLQDFVAGLDMDWAAVEANFWTFLKNGATSIVGGTVGAVFVLINFVVQVVMGLIFALYILFDKERMKYQFGALCKTYMPEKLADKTLVVTGLSNKTFSKYIAGQCTEACIFGILCFAGMYVMKLPYATMVSALVGVTALIPIVGAFVGTIFGAFMIMTVNFMQAIYFVIFILVLQQVESNLIYPRVVGGSVGLPAILTLGSVTVGGGLFGFTGMLFAVPVTSVLYAMVKMRVEAKTGENFDEVPTQA